MHTIIHGDCLVELKKLDDNSVDAVITDPPYGLSNTKPQQVADVLKAWVTGDTVSVPAKRGGFMGADWDSFVPPPAVWEECMRVLKPGGHMAVFAGARTQDLMGLSIRLAGFEIRDTLGWVYGSGFPKSMDISKAIDKRRDDYPAIREVVMFIREAVAASTVDRSRLDEALGGSAVMSHFLAPSRSNAGCPKWDQWQTLKSILRFGDELDAEVWRLNGRKGTPGEAWEKREVVGVKRVNGAEGSAGGFANGIASQRGLATGEREINITAPATSEAQRWDGWGTALKPAIEPIILARKPLDGTVANNVLAHGVGGLNIDACRVGTSGGGTHCNNRDADGKCLGHGDAGKSQSGATFHADESSGSAGRFPANALLDEHAAKEMDKQSGVLKSGGGNKGPRSSSWFTSNSPNVDDVRNPDSGGASRFFPVFKYQAKAPKKERPVIEREDGSKIQHPTVKPVALMEWLVELITPHGGVVLDPFAGSGTTLQAALSKGFTPIGIEQDADYIKLIEKRLEATCTTHKN